MLPHEPQVMLRLVCSLTVTGAPQFGQSNWRPCSSFADSPFRPVNCSASSRTECPRETVGGVRSYSIVSTSPSAARSSAAGNGRPNSGSRGNSPCAETSATGRFAVTVYSLPSIAVVLPTRRNSAAGQARAPLASTGRLNTNAPLSSASRPLDPSASNTAYHSVHGPLSDWYCSRPTSVKLPSPGAPMPGSRPLAINCSGLKSSNSSAMRPMRDSTSPCRTTVLWQ